MKINKARTQLYSHATVYYVRSESNPKMKYMVLHTGKNYFCQCTDFITRRLPLFGTPGFTHCKHILAVKDRTVRETLKSFSPSSTAKKAPKKNAKGFGIFFIDTLVPFRSIDMPETFQAESDAVRHLNVAVRSGRFRRADYDVRPIK